MLINILKAPRFFGIVIILSAIVLAACHYSVDTGKLSYCPPPGISNLTDRYYQVEASFYSNNRTNLPPCDCTNLKYMADLSSTFNRISFFGEENRNILVEVESGEGQWIPIFIMQKSGKYNHYKGKTSSDILRISKPAVALKSFRGPNPPFVKFRFNHSSKMTIDPKEITGLFETAAKVYPVLGEVSAEAIKQLGELIAKCWNEDIEEEKQAPIALFQVSGGEYSRYSVLPIVVKKGGEDVGQIGTLVLDTIVYRSRFSPSTPDSMPSDGDISLNKLEKMGLKDITAAVTAIQGEFKKPAPNAELIEQKVEAIDTDASLTDLDKAICLWLATAEASQFRNDPKYEKSADVIRKKEYQGYYDHYAKHPFPSVGTVLIANYKKKYATIIEKAHGVTGMRTLLMASSETDNALKKLSMNETERMNMLTQIFGDNSLFMDYAESRPGYFSDHKETLAVLDLKSTPIAAFNTQTNTMAPGAFSDRARELGEYLQSTNGTPLGLTDYVTLRDMNGELAFVQHGKTKNTLLGNESAEGFGCYIQYVMQSNEGNQTVADFIQSVRGWENLPFQGIMAYYVLHRDHGQQYKQYHALLLDMTSEETQGVGYEKAICGMYDYRVDKDFIARLKSEFFASGGCNLIGE